MGMISSKKGVMFTVLAVLVSAMILTTFFMYNSRPLDEGVDNVKLRVQNINRYTVQTDSYISKVTSVAGKKTLDFTLSIMIGNNSYLQNYTNEFQSCLLTGKMKVNWGGGFTTINCPAESNIVSKVSYFNNFSNEGLNINSKIKINGVSLEQKDQWNLLVKVNYTLIVNDSYAYWNETKVVQSAISIIGSRDPTYLIVPTTSPMYPARYQMTIKSSPTTTSWTESPSTAHQVVLQKRYFMWEGAPSFLDRLNNKTTPSSLGIVSIVSPDFIANKSVLINRSSLDFEFWRNVQVNNSAYAKYDFWQSGVTIADRTGYVINESFPGLNGTIIPYASGRNLMNVMHMDNLKYVATIY